MEFKLWIVKTENLHLPEIILSEDWFLLLLLLHTICVLVHFWKKEKEFFGNVLSRLTFGLGVSFVQNNLSLTPIKQIYKVYVMIPEECTGDVVRMW